jgi:hypothetical protein
MRTSFVRVKGLKPRVDVFTQKLHKNMIQLWKDATRAFIAETIKHIHVDTGMSRTSLVPLGRLVKMVTVIRAFQPKRKPGKAGGITDMDGGYTPGPPWRGPAAGEAAGDVPGFRLNFGSPARPVFVFEFNIRVYQYALHEDQWQSISRGQQAFLDYLKENAQNYVPTLAEWILPETH